MRATLDVVLDKPAPAPGELQRMGQDVRALARGGGISAALLIGAAAGLLPALRATRMSPPKPSGPRKGSPRWAGTWAFSRS